MYDYLIVTNVPAFYKTNLYNELSKKLKIYVVFISSQSEQRTSDFVNLNCDFDYIVLGEGFLETRSVILNIVKLYRFIKNISYKKILVGGWDLPEFWATIFLTSKETNGLTLESTVMESQVSGLKGILKKIFLSRIHDVLATGKLHSDLLGELGYQRNVIVTRGVGIINKPQMPRIRKAKQFNKRYLFIGRLSPEKNLKMLVDVFRELPDCRLTIIGFGPMRSALENAASVNVEFLNHIKNNELADRYLQHDVLILPSVSETWGLVVEEAIYFGLPVIVSNQCGVSEIVIDGENGFVFDCNNYLQLHEIIGKIDSNLYRKLSAKNNSQFIMEKDERQVAMYISLVKK